MTKRREFIKQSAFLSALLAVNPYEFQAKTASISNTLIKERIVPVSIVWDTANLITKDKNASLSLTESISEKFNLMASGKVLEKGKKFIPELIDLVGAGDWWDETIYPRVALLAGWLTHREVAAVMSPLYGQDANEAEVLKRDASILQYKIGKSSNQEVSDKELADILKLMFHRAFFRTHTLTPDKQNWENWVIEYLDYYHWDRENMDQLANAWLSNVKLDKFFDSKDEIIAIANDHSIRELELTPDFFQNKGNSHYAKALINATRALKDLDLFIHAKISKSNLMNRLKLDL